MVNKEPLHEGALKALAQKRANAIIQELTTAGGVDPARVATVEPMQAKEAKRKVVISKLNITVRK